MTAQDVKPERLREGMRGGDSVRDNELCSDKERVRRYELSYSDKEGFSQVNKGSKTLKKATER